jgi:hypothetical protein
MTKFIVTYGVLVGVGVGVLVGVLVGVRVIQIDGVGDGTPLLEIVTLKLCVVALKLFTVTLIPLASSTKV